MQDINAIIHNLLDVRETLELYRDAIGAQWIDDAIAALREKEPVTPYKRTDEVYGLESTEWACPKCDGHIVIFSKYCPTCGRAVKWDG